MVSLRSLSATNTWLRSVVASPIRSPFPRTPSATAVSTAFSFIGSIILSRSTTFSKTVLTSVLTFFACSTAPAARRLGLGSCGYTSSTNLAPKAVVALICACTLAGMYRISSGSISSLKLALSLLSPIWLTRPTWTPRSMTLALVSKTSPARSDARVTGTYDLNVPAKAVVVTNRNTATATNRISVHHAVGMRCVPDLRFMPLARQVEVAGLAVDRERDHHDLHRRDHHRGTHRAAHGLTNSGRAAPRVVPVVGVHQHDHDRDRHHLEERPDDVAGAEERVEVMVVDTGALAVDGGGAGAGGHKRHHDCNAVQRDDHDDPGDNPGGRQIADTADTDHLERINLLVDPHRTHLSGSTGTNGRRQGDGGGSGHNEPDIEVRRREPGEGFDTDGRQLVVALHRHQGAGGHRQEADDHDGPADHRERCGTQPHCRDQPQQLGPVVDDGIGNRTERRGIEPHLRSDPIPLAHHGV